MSKKPTWIVGLKATCSECSKEFCPNGKQQKKLFSNEPLACPKCGAMQILPVQQYDALMKKGDLGRPYMRGMMVLGLCGVLFWSAVWVDAIRFEGVIFFAIFAFVIGQVVISNGFRSAVAPLKVQLSLDNAMKEPPSAT